MDKREGDKPGDGGPAFPVPVYGNEEERLGLSLRDYFAAAALTGLLVNSSVRPEASDTYAFDAYLYADSMLAHRQRTGGTRG